MSARIAAIACCSLMNGGGERIAEDGEERRQGVDCLPVGDTSYLEGGSRSQGYCYYFVSDTVKRTLRGSDRQAGRCVSCHSLAAQVTGMRLRH